MQVKDNLNLKVIGLVVLFLMTACGFSPASSSNGAPPASNQEQDQAAVHRTGMSQMNEQQQGESHFPSIKLYPLDEGQQDRSFSEFRSKLLRSVREYDTTFILSILDRGIINSSDGERGLKAFRTQWHIDQPESRLWETLTKILLMGGSFRIHDGNKEFCAPYITSQWRNVVSQLPRNADPLNYQVITDKDVSMRSGPNPTAPAVTSLSYDVVRVHSDSVFQQNQTDGTTWLKIMTFDGKQGYVLDKYVRSPTDYQACFKKVGDHWFMTELAARE